MATRSVRRLSVFLFKEFTAASFERMHSRARRAMVASRGRRSWTLSCCKKLGFSCCIREPKYSNLSASSSLRRLKKASKSVNCEKSCASNLVASHCARREFASSSLVLCPLHTRCSFLVALSFSLSCCRSCLSRCAAAIAVPEPEPEVNGLVLCPERFTCRGRRELPLKVVNILKNISCQHIVKRDLVAVVWDTFKLLLR